MSQQIENASRDRMRRDGEVAVPQMVSTQNLSELVTQLELLNKKPYTEYTGKEFMWFLSIVQAFSRPGAIIHKLQEQHYRKSVVCDYLIQLAEYMQTGKLPAIRAVTCMSLIAVEEMDMCYSMVVEVPKGAIDAKAVKRMLKLPFPELMAATYLLVKYGPIGR